LLLSLLGLLLFFVLPWQVAPSLHLPIATKGKPGERFRRMREELRS